MSSTTASPNKPPTNKEELTALLGKLDASAKRRVYRPVRGIAERVWSPHPDNKPQQLAWLSLADLLLYGGAAGGGKSALLCGLALVKHERSVIFRNKSADLDGLWDELIKIAPEGTRPNVHGRKRMITPSGLTIEGSHLELPRAEYSHQGRPRDFMGFDEGAQIDPNKINFVLGWNRHEDEFDVNGGLVHHRQRCRAVIATNPPIAGIGEFLNIWFAPWLENNFADPAENGELRWCHMITVGESVEPFWVNIEDALRDEINRPYIPGPNGKPIHLQSLTFIPAGLDDNPYLKDTTYRAKLNSMREPMRSALLYGDFKASQEDRAMQIIPSEWIMAAQERWRKNRDKKPRPMISIGIDPSGGGTDLTTFARLRGVRFEELVYIPGHEVDKAGTVIAAKVMELRRNNALPIFDMTAAWAGTAMKHLDEHHHIQCTGVVASQASEEETANNTYRFFNRRAEGWWRLFEALDPDTGDDIELPPDPRLLAELRTPTYEVRGDKILVQSKRELRDLLGASTDRADAVILAWQAREEALVARFYAANPTHADAEPIADPLAGF